MAQNMTEIERKFLVLDESYKAQAVSKSYVKQGYIRAEQTVRVRLRDERGYLTIKGRSVNGLSRFEFEKEITREEALALFELCVPPFVEKYRWLVPSGKHTVEVDEFLGENEGLTLAEIELESEDEPYLRPAFLGVEVTGDPRYYNRYLTQHPYKNWEEK